MEKGKIPYFVKCINNRLKIKIEAPELLENARACTSISLNKP
jgi:hypothetical protein